MTDSSRLSTSLSLGLDVRKPAVASAQGVVVAQHRAAAEVGAQALRRGGNAVDAVIATAFAVGVVEPWMSGLGGIGAMLVFEARSGEVSVVDFGARAPAALDASAYPIVEGADADLFGWPAVAERRNLVGAQAVAIPAMVAGHGLAHELFGSRPFAELVRPAADLAEAGLEVEWAATLHIASAFADLAADPGCRDLFLPGGAPPESAGASAGPPPRLPLPALARTLRAVADQGPAALQDGPLARALAADVARGGGFLSVEDLRTAQAVRREPATLRYRAHWLHVAPELNGGPTLLEALAAVQDGSSPAAPPGQALVALASALRQAWSRRLAAMGDASPHATSTTHLGAVDAQGNVAVCTQTLLSVFGARLLSPETGILLNNGINWFDPRPGRPNSIGPGKRVLANYAPTLAVGDGEVIGLGGSGGRKILPAVANLVHLLLDRGFTLEEAARAPRIDVSGPDLVVADRRLPAEVLSALAAEHPTVLADRSFGASNFTVAGLVRWRDGRAEGAAEPWHATAEAVAA